MRPFAIKKIITENNKRKSYRKRIKKLCYRVLKGDSEAEKCLKAELSNPDARRVIQRVTRAAKKANIKAKKVGIPASNISSTMSKRKKKDYRSTTKPLQGGSPGLGKSS